MKRIRMTTIFMFLLLAMMLSAGTCFASDSWDDPDPESAKDIYISDTLTCSIDKAGKCVTYRFVPDKDGQYAFYSSNGLEDVAHDTYGRAAVYNLESGQYDTLKKDDDSGDGSHFYVKFKAEAGKTYYLQARYYDPDKTGEFNVSLVEDNIDSIRFVAASRKILRENIDAYDDGNHDWLIYDKPDYEQGDKLYVTYTDGSVEVFIHGFYEYDDDDYFLGFQSSSGNRIDTSYFIWTSDQDEGQWLPGEHEFEMTYKTVIFYFDVTVVAAEEQAEFSGTVESIGYTMNYNSIIEECDSSNGIKEKDPDGMPWFRYSFMPLDQDKLTVTTDKGTWDFYCTKTEDGFIFRTADGQVLPGEVTFTDDQDNVHWLEYDTTYRYTVSYAGFSKDVAFELQRSDAGDVLRFVRTCVKFLIDTKSLESSDYTAESWSLYEDARDALECAIGEDEDDLDRLNVLKTKLEEAVDHLVKVDSAIDPPAVEQIENTLIVTPSKKMIKLKAKDLKKKAKTVKPFKVKTPVGKVTYKATFKGKAKKFLKFKSGKLTVKKGTKKGKYIVSVKVKAAGNEEFLPKTKSCKITVVVK